MLFLLGQLVKEDLAGGVLGALTSLALCVCLCLCVLEAAGVRKVPAAGEMASFQYQLWRTECFPLHFKSKRPTLLFPSL